VPEATITVLSKSIVPHTKGLVYTYWGETENNM